MREIKFRAWNGKEILKYNNYFTLHGQEVLCFTESDDWAYVDAYRNEEPIEPVVLMQYTGLKDKNGKEIYEGDIFAEIRVKQEPEPFAKVVYDNDLGAFTVNKTNGGWVYLADFLLEEKHSEVIGNIYENPDLLTQKP